MQFQYRSTWRLARPPNLPVETVLEPPVGVSPFRFPLPYRWVAVLDDDETLAIDQASWVSLENKDPDLHRRSTLAAPTHMLSPSTLP